jgi:hypothetical protein
MKRRWVDLNDILTRKEAADLYGCSLQTLQYHIGTGRLQPVFSKGSVKLFLRSQILALKALKLHAGRPKL